MTNVDTVAVTYDPVESTAIAICLIPLAGQPLTETIAEKFIAAEGGDDHVTVDLTADEVMHLSAAFRPNRDLQLIQRIARKTLDAIDAQKLGGLLGAIA